MYGTEPVELPAYVAVAAKVPEAVYEPGTSLTIGCGLQLATPLASVVAGQLSAPIDSCTVCPEIGAFVSERVSVAARFAAVW